MLGSIRSDPFQCEIYGSGEGFAVGVELFDFVVADYEEICGAVAGFWFEHVYAC